MQLVLELLDLSFVPIGLADGTFLFPGGLGAAALSAFLVWLHGHPPPVVTVCRPVLDLDEVQFCFAT